MRCRGFWILAGAGIRIPMPEEEALAGQWMPAASQLGEQGIRLLLFWEMSDLAAGRSGDTRSPHRCRQGAMLGNSRAWLGEEG